MSPSTNQPPFVFRNKLLAKGLHFDFLRLRCGTEQRFGQEIHGISHEDSLRPRRFIAFSEWDAVVIMPCRRLYPDELNAIYSRPQIASAIAGSAGYFAYLWDHPVNFDLERKLDRFESSGFGLVIALRFEEWYRKELGLGGELLFCDFVQRETESSGLSAIIAHTLGWNDVVVVVHTDDDERKLTSLLSRIRVAATNDILEPAKAELLGERSKSPILAASYTHLIAPYDKLIDGTLTLGKLTKQIESAMLLVRVTPVREAAVRKHLVKLTNKMLGKGRKPIRIPNEMGHYSFSIDLTPLAQRGDGHEAVKLIASAREAIAQMEHDTASSYPETSTVLRFREGPEREISHPVSGGEDNEIKLVVDLMSTLVPQMRATYAASRMSIHRFAAVLTTLLDHLSDPVRSSVVRHMARFVGSTAPRITKTFHREQLDDFCHICEYAMMQATDGIVQFQHDANSLGLTGRGGYSRLILATDTYVDDIMEGMQLDKDVLITFGLRTGHAGLSSQFQIDIPFYVLFSPSRWYVLLHEAGHIIWMENFGWMHENLALFEELAREIRLTYTAMTSDETEWAARVDFIRTREIIRELFPNLLIWQIACRGELARFDQHSLNHILVRSKATDGTRELLVAVVLHALFDVIREAGDVRGRAWWDMWTRLTPAATTEVIERASEAMTTALHEAAERPSERAKASISRKIRLLHSKPFQDAIHEALESVVKALRIRGKDFSRSRGTTSELQEEIFLRIQHCLTAMSQEQQLLDWDTEFPDWMAAGEVLAVAPNGYVWTGLLLNDRFEDLQRSGSPGAYMISQLSPILSLWHRGVTGGVTPDARAHAKELLYKLGIVGPKGQFSSAPVARQQKRQRTTAGGNERRRR